MKKKLGAWAEHCATTNDISHVQIQKQKHDRQHYLPHKPFDDEQVFNILFHHDALRASYEFICFLKIEI